MLVRSVKPSRNLAGMSAPPSSLGVPLPQYTQTRVLLAPSRGICTIGSLRCQAGSLDGPHIAVALKPPESFIAMPISIGHQPSDGLRKPDSDAASTNSSG